MCATMLSLISVLVFNIIHVLERNAYFYYIKMYLIDLHEYFIFVCKLNRNRLV